MAPVTVVAHLLLTVQGMCDVQNLIFSRFLKEESEISIQKDFGHVSYTQIAEGAKK